MRNLKRALSLALALVMVMSLTIVGAGAVSVDDFSDSEEIVNKEAVMVLATLGVITGNDDGSYAPADTISRAEMSTIICRVLNGGKDPVLGEAVTNTYTDTSSHWAKNYIEYCTTLGIVAGKGDGTFDPEGDVTVAEAAKMVLVALGYNAPMEGYTGGAWQINVDARANPLGLYDDLSYTTTSSALTRDNAAQMLYNALDCKMVKYSVVLDTTSSTVISTTQLDETDKTLLEEKFDAVKVEGIVVANEMANLEGSNHLNDDRTRILVTNFADQKYYGDEANNAGDFTETEDFAIATGLDELGRSVAIYVKKEPNSINAQVLGSVILSEDNVVVTDYTKDPIKDVADDNNLDLDSADTLVAANYGNSVSLGAYSDPETAGIEKILIDYDDDGEVDYVLMNRYQFGKVTSYVTSGSGSISVNVGDTILSKDKSDNVVGFEDVAKNDYVIAAEIGNRLHVSVAETVTGNLDSYKDDKNNNTTKLTVDGEEYNVSHITGYTGSTDVIRAAKEYDDTYLDVEATFYLTKGGYIAAVGEVDENAYNYALVLATGTTGLEDRVRVILSDGSEGTYDFVTTGNAEDDPKVGEVYRYSLTSNGDIRLTKNFSYGTPAVQNGTAVGGTAGDIDFEKGKTKIDADGDVYYASASTPFFYVGLSAAQWSDACNGPASGTLDNIDADDVDVYTGYGNAPDLDTTKAISAKVYAHSEDNLSRAGAVVFYGDAALATNKVDHVLYLDSIISRTSSVTKAWVFTNDPADDGARVEKQLDGDYRAGDENTAYTYTVNPDGTYALKPLPAGYYVEDVTVKDTSNTTFVASNNSEYVITEDTLLVDDSDYMDPAGGELGNGPDVDDTLAWVVFNNSTDREAVLVVIDNEEKLDPSAKPVITVAEVSAEMTTAGGDVATVTSIENTNGGTVTYAWEYTNDNGTTWNDADAAAGFTVDPDTGALSADGTALSAGTYQFRCVATNEEDGMAATPSDAKTTGNVTVTTAKETVTITVPKASYTDAQFYLNDTQVAAADINTGLTNLTFEAQTDDVLQIVSDELTAIGSGKYAKILADEDPVVLGSSDEATITVTGDTTLIAPVQYVKYDLGEGVTLSGTDYDEETGFAPQNSAMEITVDSAYGTGVVISDDGELTHAGVGTTVNSAVATAGSFTAAVGDKDLYLRAAAAVSNSTDTVDVYVGEDNTGTEIGDGDYVVFGTGLYIEEATATTGQNITASVGELTEPVESASPTKASAKYEMGAEDVTFNSEA